MDLATRFFKAITGSKKAVVAVASVIFILLAPQLAKIGLTVTEEEIQMAVLVAVAYLTGQGLADVGKEKAKVEAKAAKDDTASGEIG